MADIPTSLKEMFVGIDGSPKTTLLKSFIPGSSPTITVNNPQYLPEAPNLCTITTSINNSNWYLVVRYGDKTGKVLSDLTILYGNPSDTVVCPKGSMCFRGLSKYDHNTFIENITMLYGLLKDISVTIRPQILSFNIPDLPTVLPIGTSYVGNHILNHQESFSIYVWETLKLYEDNIQIGTVIPSETLTSSEFTSTKIFNEVGSHVYKLTGTDSFNRVFEYTQTVNIVMPMYQGSIVNDSIDTNNFDLLTENTECYSGMQIQITSSDNEYIWFCVINARTISTITSDGFNIPIQSPVILAKTINGASITFKCYRITSPVIAGINNFVVNFSQ